MRRLVTALLTLTLIAASATPAAAAVDDTFYAYTANGGCGAIDFIDYGTWPDGSKHDDYVIVHDYCADGYGIEGNFLVDTGVTKYVWSIHNGKGQAGPAVYFQPAVDGYRFNVIGGDRMRLSVCLTKNGVLTYSCSSFIWRTSADG